MVWGNLGSFISVLLLWRSVNGFVRKRCGSFWFSRFWAEIGDIVSVRPDHHVQFLLAILHQLARDREDVPGVLLGGNEIAEGIAIAQPNGVRAGVALGLDVAFVEG